MAAAAVASANVSHDVDWAGEDDSFSYNSQGGSDRVMTAALEARNTGGLDFLDAGQAYNGDTMTPIQAAIQEDCVARQYYLIDPAPGANTFATTIDDPFTQDPVGLAMLDVIEGAHQTTPINNIATPTTGTDDVPSITGTTATGDLGIFQAFARAFSPTDADPGGTYVERHDYVGPSGEALGLGGTVTGSGSVSPSATVASALMIGWAATFYNVQAAAGGGGGGNPAYYYALQ